MAKGFSPTCAGPKTPVLQMLPSDGWAGTQPWQASRQTDQPGRQKAETTDAWGIVIVSWGHPHVGPELEQPKQQRYIASHVWRPEV